MKIPHLDNIFQQHVDILKSRPEMVKKFYPRRITCPTGYLDVKYFSLLMMRAALLTGASENPSDTDIVIAEVNRKLIKYDVPTYFLGKDFTQACWATEPPEDTKLEQIKLPMPACVFCLPVALTKAKWGYNIPFIAFSYIDKNVNKTDSEKLFALWFSVFPEEGGITSYMIFFPIKDTLSEIIKPEQYGDLKFEDITQQPLDPIVRKFLGSDIDAEVLTIPNESEFVIKVGRSVIQILAVLNTEAANKFYTPQIQTRKDFFRKGQLIKEALWSPNFIGANYKRPNIPQGGHHASPRMHWRRGFINHFWTGKGRTVRIMKWIEPTLVNAS